jgi:hypothetical protein
VAHKEYGVVFTDINNLPDIDDDSGKQKLLIFDDVLGENMEQVVPFFMRGRHTGYSLMFLSQSYFETDKRIRSKCDVLAILGFNSERDKKAMLGECSGGFDKETVMDVFKYVTGVPHTPLVIHLRATADQPRFFRGFSEAVNMETVPQAQTNKAVKVARAVKSNVARAVNACAVKNNVPSTGPGRGRGGFEKAVKMPQAEKANNVALDLVTDDPVSNITSNAGSAPHPGMKAIPSVSKEKQIVDLKAIVDEQKIKIEDLTTELTACHLQLAVWSSNATLPDDKNKHCENCNASCNDEDISTVSEPKAFLSHFIF